jgi:hypothetical protein
MTLCLSLRRDFEELALRDYRALGKMYGLEKFWAFHHYHGLPKGLDLDMHAEARAARRCTPLAVRMYRTLTAAVMRHVPDMSLLLQRGHCNRAMDVHNPPCCVARLLPGAAALVMINILCYCCSRYCSAL